MLCNFMNAIIILHKKTQGSGGGFEWPFYAARTFGDGCKNQALAKLNLGLFDMNKADHGLMPSVLRNFKIIFLGSFV